jgi:hypothetical protein
MLHYRRLKLQVFRIIMMARSAYKPYIRVEQLRPIVGKLNSVHSHFQNLISICFLCKSFTTLVIKEAQIELGYGKVKVVEAETCIKMCLAWLYVA